MTFSILTEIYNDVSSVKSAFRRMSMIHHPDLGGSNQQFIQLTKEYEILMANPSANRKITRKYFNEVSNRISFKEVTSQLDPSIIAVSSVLFEEDQIYVKLPKDMIHQPFWIAIGTKKYVVTIPYLPYMFFGSVGKITFLIDK